MANVSEGANEPLLEPMVRACGASLLDLHSDRGHSRSVFTMAGEAEAVQAAARELARTAVARLDLGRHSGAHPRFGVLDVVPWVALEGWPLHDAGPGPAAGLARRARASFASWAARELGLPVFLYGPERSLPEVRAQAWRGLAPDAGPSHPHPTAGSVAVGWRPLLVAYNLWLREPDLARARQVAAALRSPRVRALAFRLGEDVQVSCNLVDPVACGPSAVYDQVAGMVPVKRAELVGLVPQVVLGRVDAGRWAQLDLGPGRTIESRLRPGPWA
ncbi:MAG: hypothetical protein ACRDZX_07975 [Acidimicrobiales bacterium]